MRVAALYDIHGNLPALEAVLEHVRRERVDQIVIGGDVVLGPMPSETLERLLDLDMPVQFIRGNCDREVTEQLHGSYRGTAPEQIQGAIRWVGHQLSAAQQRELAGWPQTLSVEIPALGDVLFCHATPRNDNEIFTRLTSEDRLAPIFGSTAANVVVCGHTHMQFDRTIGKTRVVNAGSVGMPFGEPDADWLLLGPGLEFQHTPYDLRLAAKRVRETQYPQAEDFAAHYILQPPSESKMLEVFSRSELT